MDPVSILLEAISIAEVIKQVFDLIKALERAPAEFKVVRLSAQETHKALGFLQSLIKNPKSIVYRNGTQNDAATRLKLAVSKADKHSRQVDRVLKHYKSLRSDFFGRLQWAKEGKAKIQSVNQSLHDWLSLSYAPLLEILVRDIDHVHDELEEIRRMLRGITNGQRPYNTITVEPRPRPRPRPTNAARKRALRKVMLSAKYVKLWRSLPSPKLKPKPKPIRKNSTPKAGGYVLARKKDGTMLIVKKNGGKVIEQKPISRKVGFFLS